MNEARKTLDALHKAKGLHDSGRTEAASKALNNLASAMAPPPGTGFEYDAESQRLTITHLSGRRTEHDCERAVYEKYVEPLRHRKVQ